MTRRLERHRSSETGLTMLELIVAMGISSILIALVVTMFVGTIRSFSDQEGGIENSRMASTAMNEVTRILRAGTEIPEWGKTLNQPVFEHAGAEKIIMRSFIDAASSTDPAPLRVQFARNASNELVESRVTGTHEHVTYWVFGSTWTSSRTIARSLLAPSSTTPLFRYFDRVGTELVPAAGASLSEADRRNIASVQVTMQVQADRSGRVAPVTLQNMVGLPNLGIARVEVR